MFSRLLIVSIILTALASAVMAQSSLNVIDVILDAPVRPQTCAPTVLSWSWDMAGNPPDDPIALSIINATDFGLTRSTFGQRKRSSHPHMDSQTRMEIRKRATIRGVPIVGAEALPFSDGSFVWPQLKAFAGQYRLLLTILSSGQSVVSDPFLVNGSDTSCLGTGAASATVGASSGTTSSAAPGGNSASVTSPAGTPSSSSSSAASNQTPSSIPTLGSSASGSTGSSSSASSNQDDANASSGGSNHGGAIAAGVIVPLLAIAAAVFGWFWYRKRKASGGQAPHSSPKPTSAWSEKFFGGGAATEHSRGASHMRGISGPQAASAAGLAAVAGMVPAELRQEKDHAALQARTDDYDAYHQQPDLQRGLDSPISDDWVDFGAEEAHNIVGPRPLSRDTIDSAHIGDYASHGVPSSVGTTHGVGAGGLYAQGRNVPLGSRPSSQAPHDSISTFGTPAHRASNVSQASVGRDLIAAMPQPPSTGNQSLKSPSAGSMSREQASPFDDDAVAVDVPRADANAAGAYLDRSDSSGSTFGIKRKPVPRLTIHGPSGSNEELGNPFTDGDDAAVDVHSSDSAAYDAFEAVETVGARPDDSPVVPLICAESLKPVFH